MAFPRQCPPLPPLNSNHPVRAPGRSPLGRRVCVCFRVFQTLKFGIGDGHLQYYLFNWRCKEITPEEVGLVLL